MADIDINNISEALNDKADADLENTIPQCIDYVIEYKAPTTEDPNWYRVYKSGWCEQGGVYDNGSISSQIDATIILPKLMSDIYYTVTITPWRPTSGNYKLSFGISTKTTNSFVCGFYASNDSARYINWEAKGFVK